MDETPQRPLERRVSSWVESGRDPGEIAARFRRSPELVERVVALTQLSSHRDR